MIDNPWIIAMMHMYEDLDFKKSVIDYCKSQDQDNHGIIVWSLLGYSAEEIAKEWELSVQWVRFLRNKHLNKIRTFLKIL